MTSAGGTGPDVRPPRAPGVRSSATSTPRCRGVLAHLRAEIGMGLWFVVAHRPVTTT